MPARAPAGAPGSAAASREASAERASGGRLKSLQEVLAEAVQAWAVTAAASMSPQASSPATYHREFAAAPPAAGWQAASLVSPPVGEPLAGTALAPLVLTGTAFHYRSPN